MPHLDEGQLTLLLDNELDQGERASVEAHLRDCAECRELLEETRGFMQEADRLIGAVDLPPRSRPAPAAGTPPAAPTPASRPLPWRSLAWAATVVLAAGLGWFASDTRFHPPQAALTDAAPAKGAPTADAIESRRSDAPMTPADSPQAVPPSPAPGSVSPPAAATPRAAITPPRGNLATNAAGARDERETPPLTEQAANPSAPAPAPAEGSARRPTASREEPVTSGLAATGGVARQPAAKGLASTPGFQEISLDQAVRALGGTVRLLDGLTPVRAEAGPPVTISSAVGGLQLIRIVYEDPPGRELWLSQQRITAENDLGRARRTVAQPVLEGDTLLGNESDGRRTLQWRDRDGFLLVLSGYLPGDSLKSLARRVR